MSRMEIIDNKPDVIVTLVEKILDTNERQLERFYTPKESPIDKDFGREIRKMYDDDEIPDIVRFCSSLNQTGCSTG